MDPYRAQILQLQADVKKLEGSMRKALVVTGALQGQPSDATLAIAHNDSWLFEDNVDGTHPANLRYVIAATTQRIVSARLSIHLAPFRTYNTLSVGATGTNSAGHSHGHNHGGHTHSIHLALDNITHDPLYGAGSGLGITQAIEASYNTGQIVNSTTPSTDSTGESGTHTHNVSATGILGVTEGATATGVAISFDGVDATAALGGPFNADVIELDVRPYLLVTQGLWHVIAMQPSGLGRIEAHLRLGVYVSAGQVA
jgi:hypothetical protein